MKRFVKADSEFNITGCWIHNYRIGKSGTIRFDASFQDNVGAGYDRYSGKVEIVPGQEPTIGPDTRWGGGDDITILNKLLPIALNEAVEQGYLKEVNGEYVDNRSEAKASFLNMLNMSYEELESILPGKVVYTENGNSSWRVYGLFTAYNGKDYVAMKKVGSFADPNLVELSRFKKSYHFD